MIKSKSILLPKILGLPLYAVDYETGQKGVITIQKAKDIVFAAVLNKDGITVEQDNFSAVVITIISHTELDKAKEAFDIKIIEKVNP